MIDPLIKAHGVDVSIKRLTVPVYDANDALDEAASTFATEVVKAILSQRTKGWEYLDQGLQARPNLVITVASTVDIRADRAGRPDQVQVDGVWHIVRETRTAKHPFAGFTKLSASLTPLPGR